MKQIEQNRNDSTSESLIVKVETIVLEKSRYIVPQLAAKSMNIIQNLRSCKRSAIFFFISDSKYDDITDSTNFTRYARNEERHNKIGADYRMYTCLSRNTCPSTRLHILTSERLV